MKLSLLIVGALALAVAQDEPEEEDSRKETAGQYGYCGENNCYDLLEVKRVRRAVSMTAARAVSPRGARRKPRALPRRIARASPSSASTARSRLSGAPRPPSEPGVAGRAT